MLEKDRERRTELISLYKEGEIFLSKLPLARRKELEQVVPNFAETLNKNVINLQRDDCAILVAGKYSFQIVMIVTGTGTILAFCIAW